MVNNKLKLIVCQHVTKEAEKSTFPPKLSLGLPKRHHLVIDILDKLKSAVTSERLQKHISPDADRTGASLWLDRQMVETITLTTEQNMANYQLHKLVPDEIR